MTLITQCSQCGKKRFRPYKMTISSGMYMAVCRSCLDGWANMLVDTLCDKEITNNDFVTGLRKLLEVLPGFEQINTKWLIKGQV